MAWVYLDDGIATHPKIVAAGTLSPVAPWLFVAGLAYCRRHLTGGQIPLAMVPTLTPLYRKNALGALVDVGLWEPEGPIITVHDYAEWNDREDAQREQRSSKARAAAQARWKARPRQMPEQMLEHGQNGAQAHPPPDAQAMPSPSPPLPVADALMTTTTSDLQPPRRRLLEALEEGTVHGGWR